ncbi:hypothetical protein GCM10010319_14300 [Streptomyces blastmyceticus]|uniref:Secreted protein n=1 Tax=Streptomyces blastmyceticus TaxID=68180 RepID=A0ABP3GA07_9ACTN
MRRLPSTGGAAGSAGGAAAAVVMVTPSSCLPEAPAPDKLPRSPPKPSIRARARSRHRWRRTGERGAHGSGAPAPPAR